MIFNSIYYRIYSAIQKKFRNISLNAFLRQLKHCGKNINIEWPFLIVNPAHIRLGDNFSSKWNLRIEAITEYRGVNYNPEIIIGDNVIVNSDVHIGAINKIVIGNGVLMASHIFISDHTHGKADYSDISTEPYYRQLSSKGPVIIEDNVWIGEGVCVLPGVVIGKNSIVGANSVVNKSVPPSSVVAGIPAKVIKSI